MHHHELNFVSWVQIGIVAHLGHVEKQFLSGFSFVVQEAELYESNGNNVIQLSIHPNINNQLSKFGHYSLLRKVTKKIVTSL